MDADSFTDLALRVLAGEATEGDRRALETELAAPPARREEFEQVKLTQAVFRTVAPMAEAAHASEPELPAWRLNELRTAVRRHFGPATKKEKLSGGLVPALRWLFAGGGATALAVVVIFLGFSNRSVEVGLYGTDLVRGGDTALSPADVPAAHLVTFDQDTPFEEWQNRPLAWYEHAKVWVDNEHDQLHIVRRVGHGEIRMETELLAPTNQGQREQIKRVVESLEN